MKIGNNIRKIREFKGYTQDHISSEIGMNQSSYSKIESGETDITFSKLEQIAVVLGLQVEEIISFDQKIVFNMMHNKNAKGLTINQAPLNEKRIYDEIATLKSEIINIKKTINKLLSKSTKKTKS